MSVTPQQIREAGPDAVARLLEIMQRNSQETALLNRELVESLQRDLDEARRTIARIQHNIHVTLRYPHSDYMIEEALHRKDWMNERGNYG